MKTTLAVLAVSLLAACGRTNDIDAQPAPQPSQTAWLAPHGVAPAAPVSTPDAGRPVPSVFDQCFTQVQDACIYDDPASGGDGFCHGNFTGIICGQHGAGYNGAECTVQPNSQRWINWQCSGSPFDSLRPARCYVPADTYCLTHGPGAPGLIPGSYCHDVDGDGLDDLVFGWTQCVPTQS